MVEKATQQQVEIRRKSTPDFSKLASEDQGRHSTSDQYDLEFEGRQDSSYVHNN